MYLHITKYKTPLWKYWRVSKKLFVVNLWRYVVTANFYTSKDCDDELMISI